MPKFMTIGYGDEEGYERTAPKIRDAAHEHEKTLVRGGAIIGAVSAPVQVRNPDGKGIQTDHTAFMSSPLPIAGFALIEAADIAEAIKMVSESPCAVAHGIPEIWPLMSS